ncbi:4-hydroxy-tetrahydrodipicolinate reductase [Buchnera aphidicola (Takecallis arundicolens)]|uniref:4-hydroxy-tetrahydrodipicolinate reductase n=1 Tax=Buchnera aphidicola TaxID=9 RepID=UPI00346494FF
MKKKNLRIAITGAYGRMGSNLIQTIQEYKNINLACAIVKKKTINILTKKQEKILIYTKIEQAIENFDVLIDFSTPKNTLKNLYFCEKYNKNIIIGTTGFNTHEHDIIKNISKKIGIVISSNFSIGINLIFRLLKQISNTLDDSYDIEIIESHHRNKIDSPSGTALSMGEIIAKSKKWNLNTYGVYRKKQITDIREKNKIGFSIIRGGDIIGEHQVMFLTSGEKITLSHQASNRNTFSKGAIQAAIWITQQTSGLFNMMDVLNI